MIAGKKVLAIIPARGGSKRLPNKNILQFAGKPLIAWTIDAALAAKFVDRVVLSSDDDNIIAVARSFGCDVPFKRAAELATDEASSADVVLDAIDRCPGYDIVVLLQATSPLRTAEDIDAALALFTDSAASSCVSVSEAAESPYWMYSLTDGNAMVPVLAGDRPQRAQDLPKCFSLNGAIYIARTGRFMQTPHFVSIDSIAYEMPGARSIDVDTQEDFDLAEFMFSRTLEK